MCFARPRSRRPRRGPSRRAGRPGPRSQAKDVMKNARAVFNDRERHFLDRRSRFRCAGRGRPIRQDPGASAAGGVSNLFPVTAFQPQGDIAERLRGAGPFQFRSHPSSRSCGRRHAIRFGRAELRDADARLVFAPRRSGSRAHRPRAGRATCHSRGNEHPVRGSVRRAQPVSPISPCAHSREIIWS